MKSLLHAGALGFLLAAALVPGAAAQTPASASGWAAWTGCWRLLPENGRAPAGASQPAVCVTEVPGGAHLTTTVGNQPALEQTILTDGAEHQVDQSGCRGRQRNEWSASGLRMFSSAELTCEGDPAPRRVSGYSLLLENGDWLDIQAIEIDGRDNVRVRRYRHADAGVAPRVRPGRTLGLDDVKEAAPRLSSAALEAAVVETGAVIPLSGKALIGLEQAQVPGSVIDLMIAVAYPEKFVVQRSGGADRGWLPPLYIDDPFSFGGAGSPFWGSGLAFYEFNPYFYSPFGYSYYGRFDPRFLSSGTVFGVDPGSGGGGDPRPVATGTGRAVDGRGYTQVRPREPQSEQAERSRRPASVNGASSSASPPPSSSSGAASSSGYSSGTSGGGSSSSSSDGGGRTAVPR